MFYYNRYFLQRPFLKWICFPVPVHYNISKITIFGATPPPPVFLLGQIEILVYRVFCREFNSEQPLFEVCFYKIRILCNLQP